MKTFEKNPNKGGTPASDKIEIPKIFVKILDAPKLANE